MNFNDNNELIRRRLDGSGEDNVFADLGTYPPPFFTDTQIRQWAWILYFIGMFYMFVGIGIVCDDYFVPTLEVIVERLNMSHDVAGATWLAAGGSAPELFTSCVGVFLADNQDVGFGTIIGSAVFNILFVIGMVALFTPGDLALTWWPFARDNVCYITALTVLSILFRVATPGEITWYESLILLCLYLVYVGIMSQNDNIKRWFYYTVLNKKKPRTEEQTLLSKNNTQTKRNTIEMSLGSSLQKNDQAISPVKDYNYSSMKPITESPRTNDTNGADAPAAAKTENSDDDDEEGPSLEWPADEGLFTKFIFIISFPLAIMCYATIFDMTIDDNHKLWYISFVMSLVWLGLYSYCMVWWAEVVGAAWGIDAEIMGFIFLAAGTSVPELFSCILVAKKGKGDMAVSGSVGSNIFDICIGLSLPWFAWSMVYQEAYQVQADNLFISILVLVIMLAMVLFIIILHKWTLTKRLGILFIVLWVLFVAQDLARWGFELDTKWFSSLK